MVWSCRGLPPSGSWPRLSSHGCLRPPQSLKGYLFIPNRKTPASSRTKSPISDYVCPRSNNPHKDLRSPVRCRRLWITAVSYWRVSRQCPTLRAHLRTRHGSSRVRATAPTLPPRGAGVPPSQSVAPPCGERVLLAPTLLRQPSYLTTWDAKSTANKLVASKEMFTIIGKVLRIFIRNGNGGGAI
jgi:hypothetical protein